MPQHSAAGITQLLQAWGTGDELALQQLMPLVYDELRRSARRRMARERPGHSLQTSALVHEVYLRLINYNEVTWQDRAHFFAVCAQMMRRILIDSARARRYRNHGVAQRVDFEEALVVSRETPGHLLALDEALTALAAVDPRKSQVVELRYFGGLSVKETAEVLTVSEETVKRDWRLAKLWLLHELGGEERDGA